MTLNKKSLREWEEGMHLFLSDCQRAEILKHFGTEPEPHVWSEQDIAEQLNKYLTYGYFQKPEPAFRNVLPPCMFDDPF